MTARIAVFRWGAAGCWAWQCDDGACTTGQGCESTPAAAADAGRAHLRTAHLGIVGPPTRLEDIAPMQATDAERDAYLAAITDLHPGAALDAHTPTRGEVEAFFADEACEGRQSPVIYPMGVSQVPAVKTRLKAPTRPTVAPPWVCFDPPVEQPCDTTPFDLDRDLGRPVYVAWAGTGEPRGVGTAFAYIDEPVVGVDLDTGKRVFAPARHVRALNPPTTKETP